MTGHLSRERLLALVETPAAGDAHLDACERCRAEVLSLREILRDVRRIEVPEPSPLFWDHLSGRIHQAVAREAARPHAAVTAWGRWSGWAAPLTAAVCLALAILAPRAAPDDVAHDPLPAALSVSETVNTDDDWELLVAIVCEGDDPDREAMPEDGSLTSSLGSANSLVADLTLDERATLVDIIKRELGEPKKEGS
jgi:hypothetical protein